MKTKLVYVLTCAPDKFYIEQALMSTFSARHWNPDAHIVLIVDNLTDKLLVGKRAEVLDYVSEKIVVPFEDASLSMMYRSRFIKTSVRQRIKGDYLFIDCDTIVTRSLCEVDLSGFIVGAALESMIPVSEYCRSLFEYTLDQTQKIGVDLKEEPLYFNSGVMFVKDVPEACHLYHLWHQYWIEGLDKGLSIDQPALAKANRALGRMISQIPGEYNFMLWTRAKRPEDAAILHISSFRNPSFLFTEKVLEYVRDNGLKNHWIVESIKNPCASFLPFDFDILSSTREQRKEWINEIACFSRGYGETIDASFADFPMKSRFRMIIIALLRRKCNLLAARLWMVWSRIHVWRHRKTIKDNVCRK